MGFGAKGGSILSLLGIALELVFKLGGRNIMSHYMIGIE